MALKCSISPVWGRLVLYLVREWLMWLNKQSLRFYCTLTQGSSYSSPCFMLSVGKIKVPHYHLSNCTLVSQPPERAVLNAIKFQRFNLSVFQHRINFLIAMNPRKFYSRFKQTNSDLLTSFTTDDIKLWLGPWVMSPKYRFSFTRT